MKQLILYISLLKGSLIQSPEKIGYPKILESLRGINNWQFTHNTKLGCKMGTIFNQNKILKDLNGLLDCLFKRLLGFQIK